jgi:hypothetical protein
LPCDIRVCDVARTSEFNGHRLFDREAGVNEDHSVAHERRSDGVAAMTLSRPQFFAGLRIVGDDQLIAAGDQFRALLRANDQRR